MSSYSFGWDSVLSLYSLKVQQRNTLASVKADVWFTFFFMPNVSFKTRSKDLLRQPCSPWLFSNTSVYLIVGVDRLDKDLTIGQMQGKYLISLLECSFGMIACCYGYTNKSWNGLLPGTDCTKTNGHERLCESQNIP